jgi:hypothetical protein
VCVHAHTHFLYQLRRLKRNDTLVEINKHAITQIFVSDAIFQYKEPKILGEMAGSRTRVRNIQEKLGASCSHRE